MHWLAETVLDNMKYTMKEYRCDINYLTRHLFAALTYYAQYRSFGRGKHLRLARKHKRKFQYERREFRSCPDAIPLFPLLDAEDLSVKKVKAKHRGQIQHAALATSYDTAINAVAAAAGYVNMEALANERAAFVFCNQLKDERLAETYFSRSLELNMLEWGATAKHDWLSEASTRAMSNIRSWRGGEGRDTLVGNTISVGQSSFILSTVVEEINEKVGAEQTTS